MIICVKYLPKKTNYYFVYLSVINNQKSIIMSVMKVIEVMASSSESWEEATKNAVAHAAKSVNQIKSAFVQSQSVVVKDDEVDEYRVNVKITFEVK